MPVKFLSPSALDTWLTNEEEYYLKYLANQRAPKIPQTKPMSVGSSFDAYVKSYIHKVIYNNGDETFKFDVLFEKQVEVQNRDFALNAGADCFKYYKDSGHLDKIMRLLFKATEIEMEFTKKLDTETNRLMDKIGSVVLLGIPDLKFKIKDLSIILDWKVNGYTSKSGKSPTQGYVNCQGKVHNDCVIAYHGDFCYNAVNSIEKYEPGWARQLSTYAWLVDIPVGGEFIACVDQLACKPFNVKIAEHRCKISKDFQEKTYKEFEELWDRIHSGHYFKSMSKEESEKRCKILDEQANVFTGTDEKSEWLRNALRG